MNSGMESRIKSMEEELLALKTSSKYTSVRSASYTVSGMVYTGVYRVTYGGEDQEIFAILLCSATEGEWGLCCPRTPERNTQIVEIDSNVWDPYSQSVRVLQVPLVIVSNRPVVSIERIS